jgi:hypothetical protein
VCSRLVTSFSSIQLLHFVFLSREARENAELAKHRAERPKIQQQFSDLKRGLSVVTDQEWESIPEVGNLTRKKRRKDDRTFAVPDSIIVGDRSKTEYENSLDNRQQANGFETPADSGTMTNFVEIGQARDKILSLKLDQVRLLIIILLANIHIHYLADLWDIHYLRFSYLCRSERLPHLTQQRRSQD